MISKADIDLQIAFNSITSSSNNNVLFKGLVYQINFGNAVEYNP